MSNTIAKLMGVGLPAAVATQISGDTGSALTATGSTQATALLIQNDNAFFGTVAASTGAILPSTRSIGDDIIIYNGGASSLTLYPPVGFSINAGAANAGLTVASGKAVHAICRDGGNWVTILSA